jgi:hypothetical protein
MHIRWQSEAALLLPDVFDDTRRGEAATEYTLVSHYIHTCIYTATTIVYTNIYTCIYTCIYTATTIVYTL